MSNAGVRGAGPGRRLVRIAVPGLAAALGLSLTLVLTGSEAAFAGWSPAPTPVSATAATIADQACQARLATLAQAPGGVPAGTWNTVTSDERGPFTLVVYGDGGDTATCLRGPSVIVVSETTANGGSASVSGSGQIAAAGTPAGSPRGWSTISGSTIGTGDVTHMAELHMASATQGPFTVVEGQVASAVTGVTLVLGDGQKVEASTGNGWFVAWWPGTQGAASAEVTTASGVTTEPLSTPDLPAPPGS